MSRIGLQLVLGISAAVALLTGAWALKEGVLDPSWGLGPLTPTPGLVLLDTTFRFVNGIWLGLGVVFVALIPRIERRGEALAVAVTLIYWSPPQKRRGNPLVTVDALYVLREAGRGD